MPPPMKMLATAPVYFVCFRRFDAVWAYTKAWWAVSPSPQRVRNPRSRLQTQYAQLGLIKAWSDAHAGGLELHQPG